jgi:hypothetical protein
LLRCLTIPLYLFGSARVVFTFYLSQQELFFLEGISCCFFYEKTTTDSLEKKQQLTKQPALLGKVKRKNRRRDFLCKSCFFLLKELFFLASAEKTDAENNWSLTIVKLKNF